MHGIQINKLLEGEVDNLIKSLSGEPLENFKEGFHEEKENMKELSSEKRIYYSVLQDNAPYLLVGINLNPASNVISISSFARIVSEPKGMAADCIKELIEEKLVPMCGNSEPKKEVINARLTHGGYKVFKYLQGKDNIPKGVEKIIIMKAYPYWSCRLHIK